MSIKALNGFNHLNGNGHFNGSDTGGLDTSALVNQFNGLFNGSAKKLMSLNSSPEVRISFYFSSIWVLDSVADV